MLKESTGRWRTASLFAETSASKELEPLWTLQEAHDIYMECGDPTEYEVAIKLLGSWEHWKVLTEAAFFQDILASWREELEVKLKAQSIKAMITTATTDGAKGTTAAKWLAEGGWKEHKRGRPTKKQKEAEGRIRTKLTDEVGDDLRRLKLN